MDEQLISKRELLERYGISYGALYRWKRKGLIPEDWFIRCATPTGQETFFRKDVICSRMEEITAMRDEEGLSLDEMLQRFQPEQQPEDLTLTVEGKYGSKSFLLSEIASIRLSNGKGESKDLMPVIEEVKL